MPSYYPLDNEINILGNLAKYGISGHFKELDNNDKNTFHLPQGYSSEEALQWGGAAGNATASKLEDITLRDIEGYLLQMKVKKVV